MIKTNIMCSNNTGSTSACGCGCGSGSGGMWSSGLKKQQQQQQQKRTRVPKRGPGVAELEKILREQETIDITTSSSSTTTNVETTFSQQQPSSCFMNHYNHHSSSSMKSHHHHHHHHQISMPSSHHGPPPLPLVPRFDRNGSGSQEKELFPMNLTSCKSKSNINEVIGMDHGSQSDSSIIPKRSNQYHHHHPPPPQVPSLMQMNHFLGTTSTHVSSGSFSQEPPSNQSSFYHYTSRLPEEHKVVGMKPVHHTSSLDNSLIPPSNFQVLPSFSRYNRQHQSSTNDNHGLGTYNSTNEGHRDAKWGSSLELSNRRFNSDIVGAAGHANFPPFSTHEVPPPPMHLFQGVLSKGSVFSHQLTEDKIEDTYQCSESTSGAERKPFYNFLEVKDEEELTDATHGSNHGGSEAGRGGIDLSLKL